MHVHHKFLIFINSKEISHIPFKIHDDKMDSGQQNGKNSLSFKNYIIAEQNKIYNTDYINLYSIHSHICEIILTCNLGHLH
jgi:hypothetical protein